MKNTVVFDMDGILFHSERMIMECWRELCKSKGLEDPSEVCMECMGLKREASALRFKKKYGEDFPYFEYKDIVTKMYFERIQNEGVRLMKGAREILVALKDAGYRIALASSTRRLSVEKMLTKAQLIDYFEVLVCGDEVLNSKPAPDIYKMAIKKLGVKSCDAFAIEDSYNGMRSAYAAGLFPIMVPDMAPVNDEMREIAGYIAKDLFEALAFITNVEK